MAFYSAELFPQWNGNLFIGSLKFLQLVRLELDGNEVVHEERISLEKYGRVRDVRQGPDGVYLSADRRRPGGLVQAVSCWRLEPLHTGIHGDNHCPCMKSNLGFYDFAAQQLPDCGDVSDIEFSNAEFDWAEIVLQNCPVD